MNYEQIERENEIAEQQYISEINAIVKASPDTFIEAFIQADLPGIAEGIINRVESGFIPALKALVAVRSLEKIADILTNKDPKKNRLADKAILLQSIISDEISMQPEKKFSFYGASFTKTEAGTKYDWSLCNDPVLIELDAAAKNASEALKKRQDWLKTCPVEGLPILVESTGETVTVYPPSKSSTSTVSVSL